MPSDVALPKIDAAPVPVDLDLSTLSYMPLQVGKLLSSDTWLLASGDEAKAAVTLWCRAWHQVPAGSLPNDDRLLAALSGAGAKWNKVKAVALRGFSECGDGRLYHSHLCEEALEAHYKRLKWREKKRGQRGGHDGGHGEGQLLLVPPGVPGDNTETGPRGPHDVPPLRDGTGRDGRVEAAPRSSRATRLPENFIVPDEWIDNARKKRTEHGLPEIDLRLEAVKFVNHFLAQSGANAAKLDWPRTWLNWALRSEPPRSGNGFRRPSDGSGALPIDQAAAQKAARVSSFHRTGKWDESWGPKPPPKAVGA